jgi:mRNA interferase MazF
MVILQGDVFWALLSEPFVESKRRARPVVVIQGDPYNASALNSYVVAHLTSNLGRARIAGCVLLAKGEANLSRQSVVNITQITTVEEHQFVEKIGTLSAKRLREVLEGILLLISPQSPPS